jgi:hypothetical protein
MYAREKDSDDELWGCLLLTLNLLQQINALRDWRQLNTMSVKRDRDDECPDGLPSASPKSAVAR